MPPTPLPTSQSQSPSLTITVDFTGGLELLFNNVSTHTLTIPSTTADGSPATLKFLIPWLVENVMVDGRTDMFVLGGTIRPGILVLINEADWELEGEDGYEVRDGDNFMFVSTLHGG